MTVDSGGSWATEKFFSLIEYFFVHSVQIWRIEIIRRPEHSWI